MRTSTQSKEIRKQNVGTRIDTTPKDKMRWGLLHFCVAGTVCVVELTALATRMCWVHALTGAHRLGGVVCALERLVVRRVKVHDRVSVAVHKASR